MKRVAYSEMKEQFARVLGKYGFAPQDAQDAAEIFAQNSLAGVFSHGLNRFPRVVDYLRKGEIDPSARATCVQRMGAIERWDGHRGFGPLNAFCMMLFCLLYIPCAATLATIKKETGSVRWTLLAFLLPTLAGVALCMLLNLLL